MRLKLFVSLAFMFATTVVSGHWGPPNIIIYAGESYATQAEPLYQYFAEHPNEHPHVVSGRDAMEQDPAAYPDGTIFEQLYTNLMRGYVATFGFSEGALRIQDFKTPRSYTEYPDLEDGLLSEVDRYFPSPESRLVDWYTGILVLPIGELKRGEDLDCDESCILLRIEDGKLTDKADLTGEEYLGFRRRQFAAFRESKDYHKILNELRDEMDFWELDDEEELVQFVLDNYAFDELVMLDFGEARSP